MSFGEKANGLLTYVAAITCASVAFWNASKIFLRATVSRVFLSIAFQTIPYACGHATDDRGSLVGCWRRECYKKKG